LCREITRNDDLHVAGAHEPGLVGEHDGLDAVAQAELGEQAPDLGLDRRVADDELRRDLAIDIPRARSLKTSSSRAVSSSRPGGVLSRPPPERANCSMSRLVTEGASNRHRGRGPCCCSSYDGPDRLRV